MQHHDVYEGLLHEVCEETGFCKVCGMHRQQILENGYTCRFSLNLHPISHLRAKAIRRERGAAQHQKDILQIAEYLKRRIKKRDEKEAAAKDGDTD